MVSDEDEPEDESDEAGLDDDSLDVVSAGFDVDDFDELRESVL